MLSARCEYTEKMLQVVLKHIDPLPSTKKPLTVTFANGVSGTEGDKQSEIKRKPLERKEFQSHRFRLPAFSVKLCFLHIETMPQKSQ
jgi:hypothetical protein